MDLAALTFLKVHETVTLPALKEGQFVQISCRVQV